MADLTKTIKILFEGQDNLTSSLQSMIGGVDALNAKVAQTVGPFADMGRSVLKAQAALTALAAGAIALSISKFAEFQDVMLKNRGILQASDEDYARLNAVTRELGATTRFTSTEAAQGLQFLAQAGLGVENSIGALPVVLQMAQAAALGLGETADIVTNIMAGYGVEVEDLGRASDILVAGFTSSNTSLSQLGAAFKYAGPVAAALKIPLEETTAVLGKLADAGYQGEAGGTALRNILVRLIAPTTNASKLFQELGVDTKELGVDTASTRQAMQDLGVSVTDAEGNLKPFPEIMRDLQAGLERIPGSADRAGILMKIFGARGGPQLQALLTAGADSVDDLRTKIDGLGGITQNIAEQMESGIGGALRRLRSGFQATALSIGEATSGEIEPAIGGMTNVFISLADVISKGALEPILKEIGRFGEESGDLLSAIAENLPEAFEGVDFSGLIDAFGRLETQIRGALDAFFGGIDLSTAEGLSDALQLIVDGFASLTATSAGVIKGLSTFLGWLGDAARKYNDLDESQKEALGSIGGISIGIQKITGIISVFTTVMTGVIGIFGVLSLSKIPAIIAGFAGLGGTITAVTTGALAAFSATLAAIGRHPVFLALMGGAAIGTGARKLFPGLDTATQSMFESIGALIPWSEQAKWAALEAENLAAAVGEVNPTLQRFKIEMEGATEKAEAAATPLKSLTELVEELSELKPELKMYLDVEDTDESRQSLQDAIDALQAEANGYPVISTALTRVDELSAREAERKILDVWEQIGERADGTPIMMRVETDRAPFEEIKEEVEKLTDDKKILVQLETEKIRAQAQTVEAALKFSAEIQIAAFEADANRLIALSESISSAFTSTGEAISSIVGEIGNFDSRTQIGDRLRIERALRIEQEMRAEQHEMQKDIFQLEKQRMEMQLERMASGDSLVKIEIDSSGLEPALELIMWEIIEKVQLRASESLAEFLLGVP